MIFVLLVAGAFALATLRRYIVTITLTSFILILIPQLHLTSGVPVIAQQRYEASNSTAVAPWVKPCGVSITLPMKKKIERHKNVHNVLRTVRTQMRIAQGHYNHFQTRLNELYKKQYVLDIENQQKIAWLQKNHLEWYGRDVWCLEKGQKAEHALPRLFDALQRFAITFVYLQHFELEFEPESSQIMNQRNMILYKMQYEILTILCEVKSAIQDLHLELPADHTEQIMSSKSNSPQWVKKGDYTIMFVQDSGVLKIYETFLNDWIKAFRNAALVKGNMCNPKRMKPLNFRPIFSIKSRKRFYRKNKKTLLNKKHSKLTRKRTLISNRTSSLSRKAKKSVLLQCSMDELLKGKQIKPLKL